MSVLSFDIEVLKLQKFLNTHDRINYFPDIAAIVSLMLSMKVDRFGNKKVSFTPKYSDKNSEEYRVMEFEAKLAVSKIYLLVKSGLQDLIWHTLTKMFLILGFNSKTQTLKLNSPYFFAYTWCSNAVPNLKYLFSRTVAD